MVFLNCISDQLEFTCGLIPKKLKLPYIVTESDKIYSAWKPLCLEYSREFSILVLFYNFLREPFTNETDKIDSFSNSRDTLILQYQGDGYFGSSETLLNESKHFRTEDHISYEINILQNNILQVFLHGNLIFTTGLDVLQALYIVQISTNIVMR